MKKEELQRIESEREISNEEAKKQMDIFNSVKSTYDHAAAAAIPVVKTVNVERQIGNDLARRHKTTKQCAVEKQTTKVNTPNASSQTSASQNNPIKLKMGQTKVYLT